MNLTGGFGNPSLSRQEFEALRRLIYQRLGICLTKQKQALLAGRLRKTIQTRGFSSYQEYYEYLVSSQEREALRELADCISTNHTYFYREKEHFEFFVKTAMPETIQRHRKARDYDLRIWCAGCSTGEEPYTVVMLMQEHFGRDLGGWNSGVLATDISSRALANARAGLYAEENIASLPKPYLRKYFKPASDHRWDVVSRIKSQVTFRRFNLMTARYPFHRPFDMIFCRNVMIYFDEPTRCRLAEKFGEWLRPGGYLFIGHSESLRPNPQTMAYVAPSIYCRRGG